MTYCKVDIIFIVACEHIYYIELNINRWPVTGTYTGITYSNMYCAICNGALHPLTEGGPPESFDSLKALEFWTKEIYCDNSTIMNVENEKTIPTADVLQTLVQQRLVRLRNYWKADDCVTYLPIFYLCMISWLNKH